MVQSLRPAASPLTPEQRHDLDDAKERAGAFLGAARVAAFNGWTVGFFAVVSILFGLFNLTSFLVGVGLAIVARNELVGRRRLLALEQSGLELLWRNQVGFLALIIAYCGWSMYRTVASTDSGTVELAELLELTGITELTEVLGADAGELIRSLVLTVYAVVIVAASVFQGLNARYYFVRVARIRDYVRDTPQWVIDQLRSPTIE